MKPRSLKYAEGSAYKEHCYKEFPPIVKSFSGTEFFSLVIYYSIISVTTHITYYIILLKTSMTMTVYPGATCNFTMVKSP